MSATKKEIAKSFSEKTQIHPSTSLKMIDHFFESIVDVLASHHRIEVRNFGVFEAKKRRSRKARNPKTGDVVFTVGSYGVRFKAGKNMIEKVAESFKNSSLNELESSHD